MNILLKTNGGRGGRGRKPDFVGGGRQTESLIISSLWY